MGTHRHAGKSWMDLSNMLDDAEIRIKVTEEKVRAMHRRAQRAEGDAQIIQNGPLIELRNQAKTYLDQAQKMSKELTASNGRNWVLGRRIGRLIILFRRVRTRLLAADAANTKLRTTAKATAEYIRLTEEIEKLETVISGYEDTINERDRENTVLSTQLGMVKDWVKEFQSDQDVNSGDQGIICGYWDNLDTILSSTAAPLAVVEGYIHPMAVTRWEKDNNILIGRRRISPDDKPVTVAILARGEGE